MHRLGKLGLPAAVALLLFAIGPAQAASPCPVKPSLDPGAIADDENCSQRSLDDFANMAWETFKMLVWPAATKGAGGSTLRGVADHTREFKDTDDLLVFETFKSDWETFPANFARPLDWDAYPPRA